IQPPSSVNIGGRFNDGNFPFIPSQSPIFPNIPDIPNVPDVPDDNVDDIPVPGDDDDIPVPGDNEIPEPATIVLFGLGSGFLLRRRKKM
ncbi:MAG: PEP-CTERM sorting domain-containing protein, partial [Planctomycetota bacterium]